MLLAPATGGDLAPLVSDKLLHGALFAALGLLGWWSGWPRTGVLTGLALWALVTELLQHAMATGRRGDPLDLLADLLGLGVAVAVGAALHRWHERARRRRGVLDGARPTR